MVDDRQHIHEGCEEITRTALDIEILANIPENIPKSAGITIAIVYSCSKMHEFHYILFVECCV